MSAVSDAVTMLSQAGITSIDAVEGNNLPQELVDSLEKTVVLITDAANDPTAHGDNDFWALNQEVEVQIWYSKLLDSDPEAIEIAMMKAFTHQHWQVAAVRQRTLDPDTQQLFNTFYFSRTKNI
ncbi:putative tail component [Lactobacillus phage Lc-Nu]|uniref:Tail component n=1 Tax=Lactobacillus phage Lc-Nu TaxID=146269 RepID=A8YQJ6_9CAUD|nr:tail protein [Lactobacillus phage Lc-Nu]AAR04633.1 putative tail component [Lactobacillus phage Lc-Nu]